MKHRQSQETSPAAIGPAAVWTVYGMWTLAQLADLHSTAIGLAAGLHELNPIARAATSFLPPLLTILLLKLVATGLVLALLLTWRARDDRGEMSLPVFALGVIALTVTIAVAWRNYP